MNSGRFLGCSRLEVPIQSSRSRSARWSNSRGMPSADLLHLAGRRAVGHGQMQVGETSSDRRFSGGRSVIAPVQDRRVDQHQGSVFPHGNLAFLHLWPGAGRLELLHRSESGSRPNSVGPRHAGAYPIARLADPRGLRGAGVVAKCRAAAIGARPSVRGSVGRRGAGSGPPTSAILALAPMIARLGIERRSPGRGRTRRSSALPLRVKAARRLRIPSTVPDPTTGRAFDRYAILAWESPARQLRPP
jgi:hypothetical protein